MKTSLQKLAFLYLFLIWRISSAQTFVKPLYTTNSWVNTSAVRGDTLILGGYFNNIGISTGGLGLVSTQSDIPDANFPKIDGQVYASVSDDKGGWYVSGKFLKEAETTPGGYTISRIEHILPNNTFDPDFSIIDNNAANISKLAIFNNKLYIGGSFSTFMGRTVSSLIALDLSTKKLTDWNPQLKDTKTVEVKTLLINNGTLYIGGWFTEVNGEKRDDLAAFDLLTGNLKKWNPQFADRPGIADLCIYNDKLIVGGGFSEKGVVFGGNSCLLIDTKTGTEYSFLFRGSDTYWASGVDAIEVSGNTLFAKSTGTYDTRIVAYDLVKKEFLWKKYFNMIARVIDMKYYNGTLYMAGGNFDTYFEDRAQSKEISKIGNVFAIDPKTGNLRDWTPSPSTFTSNGVYTLSFWGDKILIGGAFEQMKSVNRYSIVMYDTKNRLPFLWDADLGYGSSVSSIKLFDNKLYFAGGLNGKNDKPYSNLAAFDLKTGKSLDIKLPVLKSGRINVIEADNERLYVGGSFEIESLGKIRKNLIVLDRKTGEVIDWSPNPDREVNTLKIQDKILYVGGGFLQINEQKRPYLVSFNTSTLSLTDWNPTPNSNINDLVIKDNLLYVGGGFSFWDTERRNAFAVIDLKTGKLTVTNPLGSTDRGGEVKTIQLKGNYALLGGNFLFGDNNKCNNLVLVDLLSGVGTRSDRVCVNVEGYQNSVYKLNFVGDDLYFGGRFWKTNQQYIPNLGIIRFPQGFFDSAKPTTPTITAPNTTVCAGSSTTLTSSACTGGTLTWTGGLTGNSITISPTLTKSYKVVCSLKGVNSDSSVATTITVIAKPTQPKITASNSTICSGSSVTLTSTACTGGTLTWTGGATGSSITVSPNVTKSYKVLCTQGTCKSDSSVATTITVTPKPTQPKITASNSTICVGSSVTLTSTACTGGILTWTGGLTGSSITVSPNVTKSYKVLCSQGTCKSDSSVATTITVIAKPTQPKITASNSTICIGSSTTLTASACTGGTLTWTGGATGSSITVSPTKTKSYKVLCTQGTCKSDSSVATTITVIPKPTQPKITASNSTICAGGSVTLTSSACTGGVSTWTGGATGSSITVSPTATKSYKVLCTQGTCKSDSSVATTITLISKPTQPKITASNSTICLGSSTVLTSNACTGGTSTWTGGLTGNSIMVSPIVSKSYKVLCTQSGCKSDSSAALTITVIAKPTQPKITASNSTICTGSSVTLTSSVCTGGTSTWTGGLTGNSITVSPTATKSYKVLCTQGTCKSDSSVATTITVIAKPTQPKITASNSAICAGSSTTLTSTACTGGTLTWTGGLTGSSITVSPTKAKSYKVLCTQGTCKSDSSLATTITVIAKPTQPKITVSNSTICSGSSVTLTSTACTGGTLTWTGGLTGSLITVSPTVTKSYKVLCTQGTCKSDSSLATTITVISKPTQPKITASNSTICSGGSTVLTSTACTDGVLTWTGGLTGSSITVFPIVTKSYKVLCTQGTCKSDSSIATTITVINKPTAPIITKLLNNSIVIQWDKTIGGDSVDGLKSIVSTKNGGFMLGGYTFSGISGDKTKANKGDSDYWVVEIDANGNKLWDKNFGGNNMDGLQNIIASNDGGYILGGDSKSGISGDRTQVNNGGQDYWVVKIDANGNKLWDKSFGGNKDEALRSIVSTKDGGFILGGYTFSSVSGDKTQINKGDTDYWLVKIDANGNKLWDKSFGGNNYDNFMSIVESKDGGFLLGGYSFSNISGDKTQVNKGDSDYWVVKIDINGNKLWDKSYGGMDKEYLSDMVSTIDGGFMLGGYTFSNISGDMTQANKGGIDYWVVKIDANGNKLWDKSFGGNSSDYLWSIKSNNIGEVILGGYSWSDKSGDKSQDCKGNYDYWIVKIDANGNKLWDKSFGGDNGDLLQSIVVTNDSGFLIGGFSYSGISGDKTQSNRGSGSGEDYWILKVKENQSSTLTATGCTETVNWSNGATGNSITVSPTVATTYTATCTVNTCKSAASNAITVSPDIVPNGRIETTVAIESEPSFNFKVFPNPAKDELMIQSDLEGEATFYLYNSIGQQVLEKTFEKQTKIDLKNLSKGSHIYLIQHDKTQTSGKVLLE